MSYYKTKMTPVVIPKMDNLPLFVLNQKTSNLCVPLSLTTLLFSTIEKDLHFVDKAKQYTLERIFITLTMIVYPQSLAGMNLNPNEEEKKYQKNDIITLLDRVCKKTFFNESGWEIIRKQGFPCPPESICHFKIGILSISNSQKYHFKKF